MPESTMEGNFVLESQDLANKEGFRNVSKVWFDQTIPIAAERERLLATRDQRYSLSTSLGRIVPEAAGGRCVLRLQDRMVEFDRHSAGQFGQIDAIKLAKPQSISLDWLFYGLTVRENEDDRINAVGNLDPSAL